MRRRRGRVRPRRAHALATDDTPRSRDAHQPFDRTARDARPLAHQLPPDLARAVDLVIRPVDPLDGLKQCRSTLRAGRALRHVGEATTTQKVPDGAISSTRQIGSTP
jgi:hypothetical protein